MFELFLISKGGVKKRVRGGATGSKVQPERKIFDNWDLKTCSLKTFLKEEDMRKNIILPLAAALAFGVTASYAALEGSHHDKVT